MKTFPLALFTLLMTFGYTHAQTAYSPDLSMTQADFEAQVLENKDEIWVVDFWASWCGPCIKAVPHLKALHNHYGEKKVRFISISWDKKAERWNHAMNRLQMPWQHIRVPKGEEAFFDKHFDHNSIPTAFVVYPGGKIKKVSNVDALEGAINKAIKKSGY